jgi:hypothetical protein
MGLRCWIRIRIQNADLFYINLVGLGTNRFTVCFIIDYLICLHGSAFTPVKGSGEIAIAVYVHCAYLHYLIRNDIGMCIDTEQDHWEIQ